MTSQINTSNIDATYPVAGQDNDTQGFRDNFSNIKTALSTAKSEITTLQTNSILAANLTDNSVVANDLQGSSINNGYYNNFHGVLHNESNFANVDISIPNGAVQLITVDESKSYTFRDWAADTYYAVVRVHFKNNGTSAPYDITLTTAGGGDVVKDNNFPDTLTVGITGKHQVVEAWSYNNGATVFVKYLGEF